LYHVHVYIRVAGYKILDRVRRMEVQCPEETRKLSLALRIELMVRIPDDDGYLDRGE